mgnify:CR=1 FL=1
MKKDVRSMKLTMQLKSRSYDIILKAGCLANLHQFTNVQHRKVFVLTDSGVPAAYAQTVAAQCPEATVYTIPQGEGSKCLKVYGQVLQAMLAFGMDRKDLLVSVGGGVVGDLGGFCAASYMRGIDFVNCPTTVLSQVDSSIGGKTAIDLGETKNIVGAFWQPKLVLMDPECLNTLSDRIFNDGMAEVIKYGCIRDAEFFDELLKCGGREGVMGRIEYVLETCCAIKAQVVLADERDTGLRMILNFGHTLGHAVESYYHYETYTHGSAVAAGMCMMTKATCTPELYVRLCDCVKAYDLPTEVDAPVAELVPLCGNDKKRASASLRFIVCETIGRAEIRSMPFTEFAAWMGGVDA